eukprot:TRINITY_DN6307_c0_g1_i1.p1 TRINITY_DN6307_c0_g1~~TRINITY_DN6307_c0_g1_i1.p1  ORF type:complete len:207 (+),score=16.18 TRINITY_DN6307_c0_g1_i1:195-815(+)
MWKVKVKSESGRNVKMHLIIDSHGCKLAYPETYIVHEEIPYLAMKECSGNATLKVFQITWKDSQLNKVKILNMLTNNYEEINTAICNQLKKMVSAKLKNEEAERVVDRHSYAKFSKASEFGLSPDEARRRKREHRFSAIPETLKKHAMSEPHFDIVHDLELDLQSVEKLQKQCVEKIKRKSLEIKNKTKKTKMPQTDLLPDSYKRC